MRLIFFITTLLFFTAPCLSQDLTKEKEVNPVPATTQDGLVFLLVRFLFESFLFPLKE